jgi:hypothetical protein
MHDMIAMLQNVNKMYRSAKKLKIKGVKKNLKSKLKDLA